MQVRSLSDYDDKPNLARCLHALAPREAGVAFLYGLKNKDNIKNQHTWHEFA